MALNRFTSSKMHFKMNYVGPNEIHRSFAIFAAFFTQISLFFFFLTYSLPPCLSVSGTRLHRPEVNSWPFALCSRPLMDGQEDMRDGL